MTTRRNVKVSINIFLLALILGSFNNCGKMSTDHQGEILGSVPASSMISLKTDEQHYTLQSADQIVRSLASVTNVEPTTTIINEYNSRKSLMTESQGLDSVTSPMMISMTNLASQFCNEMINKEIKLATGDRSFFGNVDFSKEVSNVTPEQFHLLLDKMTVKFWGRPPSNEEREILLEGRQEFIMAIPAGSLKSSAQTKNLMLFTCSGLLSSLEFISL